MDLGEIMSHRNYYNIISIAKFYNYSEVTKQYGMIG